jgi:hypothetical protein
VLRTRRKMVGFDRGAAALGLQFQRGLT